MDGCKADVGNFVDFAQFFHDVVSNSRGTNFFLIAAPFFLQSIKHGIHLILGDGAFCTSKPNAALQLGSAVGFPRLVTFHNDQCGEFLALEGCKPMLALQALAPPAHGTTFFGEAGVDDGGILRFAARTVHGGSLELIACSL